LYITTQGKLKELKLNGKDLEKRSSHELR